MTKSLHSASRPVTAAFDRGPAKYFHGRKQILDDFNKVAGRAIRTKSGTTFLIQGAPGAGKTALMYECEKLARNSGWKVFRMPARALWDSDKLRRTLGLGNIPQVTGGTVEISAGPFARGGVTVEKASGAPLDILRNGKHPLLLKMDEAQTLETTNAPPPEHAGTVTDVLNAIHNGEIDRPVILIAAGLGTTVDTFRSLGISRFSLECLVELGSLDKQATRAVIHDWLKKEARAKGDPTVWIDAIAQETHGWPQHILSYVEPALGRLQTDDGNMTAEGLNVVLNAGRTFRSEYYEQRAHDFSRIQRHSLAKLIKEVPSGGSLDLEDIISSLTQEYGKPKAEMLFRRALHRGILHRRRGTYAIPIPSMHNWLVTNYSHIQIKSPQVSEFGMER